MNASTYENKAPEKSRLPVGLIERFLENQGKELDLKKQEDENKRQFAKYNYELAKLSIQAQSENLKNEKQHREALWKSCMLFGAFVFIAFVAFAAWAFYLGKEQFVLEIIRMVFYGGSGAFVGSAYQKYKNQPSQSGH